MASRLTEELLARFSELTPGGAIAVLADEGLATPAVAGDLAYFALERAEQNTAAATVWLEVASALAAETNPGLDVEAAILYGRARLLVLSGELTGAEANLAGAAGRFEAAGDAAGAARSLMGLTQVLTMQGRYAEAEASARRAMAGLEALGAPAALQALSARQNLATLLSYQERHAEALAELQTVRAAQDTLIADADDEMRPRLRQRMARTEMAMALALTFLDEPSAAENALLNALALLTSPEDDLDRGRARTNLGSLFSRTGQYARALEQLNQATVDLLGTPDVDQARPSWPRADVLFLELATTYLALNLLPEAETTLGRAELLFRQTGQQYELGQVLYYQGLLALRRAALPAAAAAWDEAIALCTALNNAYWEHRVRAARAAATLQAGDLDDARQQVAALQTQARQADVAGVMRWDVPMLAELHLLRLQIELAAGDLAAARLAAGAALAVLGTETPDESIQPLPHLQLRMLHAQGQIEQRAGDAAAARQFFMRAVEQMETQRALLPLEELRAAFLADKSTIYADLVVSLLSAPEPAPTEVADAFAVVERARSRTLLERLLATVDETESTLTAAGADVAARIAEVRRELYWLYNQLVGGEGSRHAARTLSAEIHRCEASIQQLERHRDSWIGNAEPASLRDLQAALAPAQQAIVYFGAGSELMAFVVAQDDVSVVRDLCQQTALETAMSELRFQMGRVEIGADYVARHPQRLLAGARATLNRIYQLVFAPLRSLLQCDRLLIIPHGPLHLAPFHALWDGTTHLLETFEVTYAASASVVVHRRRASSPARLDSLAGLALRDVAIPQAETEVRTAARYFGRTSLFVDEAASFDGLQRASAAADVLHVATHGLFRADNPFFSALKLADGWLDVRQIYRLPLAARLVVLSACESGAVQVQGSDEPIGLVRGFLGAGAETLVVSLWNVHDATAAQLMERFYAHLTAQAYHRTAAALRHAQLAAIAEARHPYFWAPYIVVGE